MKKLLLIVLLLLSISLAVGCGGNSDVPVTPGGGGEVTVGGTDSSVTVDVYSIENAKDIHITLTETDLAKHTDLVSALDNGETMPVEVNSSGVTFGVAGKYDLTYTYKDKSQKVNVYIYGAPTMSFTQAGGQAITVDYAEASEKIYENISAKNSFGEDLEVQLLSDGGMYTGIFLNDGVFTLNFVAVDKAGQKVYLTRTVTVLAGTKAPVLEAVYNYDVADDKFVLELDREDYVNFIALAINGEPISSEYCVKANDVITIDGNYLCNALPNRQNQVLKVSTTYGVSQATFNVVDEKGVSVDDQGIVEFAKELYEVGGTYSIPQMVLTNDRQIIPAVTYKVFSGAVEVSNNGKFIPTEDGDYRLEVNVRGEIFNYQLKAYYNLGFTNGMAISKTTGFVETLKQGYTLVSYKVTYLDNQPLFSYVAGDSALGDIQVFKNKIKQLNTKYRYNLTIYATGSDSLTVSQKIYFTVVNQDVTTILSTKEQLDKFNMYPNKPTATLEYATANIDGLEGSFKWTALTSSATTATSLRFNSSFISLLKQDAYLTFDIYATSSILPYLMISTKSNDNNSNVYLWGNAGSPTGSAARDWKIFDFNGNQITDKNFNAGSLCGQWVTIQIKIPYSLIDGEWNGLGMWDSRHYSSNVYLANVKVSANPFMEDTFDNSTLKDGVVPQVDDDIYQNDIYNG